MPNGELSGSESGFVDGSKAVEDVSADIDASVLEIIGQQVNVGVLGSGYQNALKTGSRYRKEVFGVMKDPSPAKFVVINMDTNAPIVASNKFLLTSVRRVTAEKFQVLYGFDEKWMLSTFGADVPIYTLSGVLINLKGDQDWVSDFHNFYENWLKASSLVRNNRQAVLYYSNRMIRGYPISKTEIDSSEAETSVAFTIDMLVRKDKVA